MTDVVTRKIPATDYRPTRVSVSNGQGTTAQYPWHFELDTRENHISAAVDFGREQLGMGRDVVAGDITRRPSADGYTITLSRFTPTTEA